VLGWYVGVARAMTVEDKPPSVSWGDRQPDKQVAAVREVTGEQDEEKILAVLARVRQERGTFDLNTAVDYLLRGAQAGAAQAEGPPEGGAAAAGMAPAVVMSPAQPVTAQQAAKPKVVDLTEENKSEDDLQRAIALSLQDGGVSSSRVGGDGGAGGQAVTNTVSGVSQEEQDVSKALEASLLESAGARRKRDPQNPHDREREADWPVGLKNVGQTCWFSAVIQSLFHLPAFRVLVLNFDPPQHQPKSEKERKILEFMSELRKLFALLLGSQRKYVDPSRAVGILRGTLGGEVTNQTTMGYDNNQQDVSEFTHKLLDWLEEAFKVSPVEQEKGKSEEVTSDKQGNENGDNTSKEEEPMESESEKTDPEKEALDSSSSSSRVSDKRNPMYSLFYGQVKIEGRNLGVDFSRTEQFGQWPLQVNGYKDIHESLEASTAAENIDSGSGVERGSQERWFTSLPPVLFLELSRFQFNTSRGIAEKVNNVLEFPQLIYLDRYLEENKVVTRLKREQVRQLKARRDSLNTQLDGFLRYHGGEQGDTKERYPLASVLNLALEFAKSGAGQGDQGTDSHAMQVDSPCPSPASLTPANSVANLCTELLSQGSAPPAPAPCPVPKVLPDGSVHIPIVRQEPESTTAMEVEQHPSTECLVPRPRHVSDLELKVLSGCLQRWRQEVDEQMASLERDIRDMESQIGAMYEEQELRKRGYRLHAVMVHEGDVNQGHYWAYVFHPGRKVWLKFNDNTVSETSWCELHREGQGGRASTSAYSCVYVDTARQDLMVEADKAENAAVRQLPADLDQFLLEDNKAFAQEILRWDEEQIRKEKEAEAGTGEGKGQEGADTRSVLIGDDPECQIIEPQPDLATSHALLAKEETVKVLKDLSNYPPEKRKEITKGNTASHVINQIYQQVKRSVHSAREQGLGERHDPRLESFLHYLVANDLTVDLYRRALLEQVSLSEYDNLGEVGRSVANLARNNIRDGEQDKAAEDILHWHRAYHQFRIACNYFVVGVEKYTENCLEEALELLTTSYIVNEKILEDPPSTQMPQMKTMNKRGLVRHFHLAVEHLNTRLVEQFETGDDPGSVAARVASILVPAIHILQARTNKQQSSGSRDPALLEEVRGRWCAMIEQPLPDRKRDYWGTIFNTVVPDDNQVVMRQPTNLRYPKLADDLRLGQRYKAAMQRLMKEQTAEKYVM